jgi:hypothetical protein
MKNSTLLRLVLSVFFLLLCISLYSIGMKTGVVVVLIAAVVAEVLMWINLAKLTSKE